MKKTTKMLSDLAKKLFPKPKEMSIKETSIQLEKKKKADIKGNDLVNLYADEYMMPELDGIIESVAFVEHDKDFGSHLLVCFAYGKRGDYKGQFPEKFKEIKVKYIYEDDDEKITKSSSY